MRNHLLKTIGLILISATYALAQVPSISSYSPTSGEIGTTVTITGSNFDATPANNIVYFGGIQATVTSAIATELTVEVPAGASYSQISVTTNGLIAYSSDYFNVTFDSDGSIVTGTPSSFDNTFRVFTSIGEWIAKAGDMDLDGKLDIVTADFDGGKYWVYQNTSTGIGSIDFASSVPFPLSAGTNEIELADFDGDGKLDVASVTESPSGTSFFLQVDRNTSTGAGSFSFNQEVLETLDSRAWSLAFGDLNGDGKTDIVVEDGDNDEVSILINTSTIGAISFAPHVDFAVGGEPYAATVADMNADGLLDVLTINASDNSVSILQNTSSGGTLSFAAKADFATNTSGVHQWITVADLDGDGLLDVAVKTETNLSALRNISTTNVGLDVANQISTTVDYFGLIEANDFNGDGKPDLSYTRSLTTIGVVPNISTVGNISFDTDVPYSQDPSESHYIAGSADFDSDGEPDIMHFTNTGTSNNQILNVMRNKSSGTRFTAFGFPEQVSPAVIDKDTKTITIAVNGIADLSSLEATFTLSNFATTRVSGVVQSSGATTNDFTNPVTYTVSAEDGSAVTDWTVTVTQECLDDEVTEVEKACGSFDFDGDILTNSGSYVKEYLNQVGCDSTVTLELTIHPTVFQQSVYAVDSYDFDGATLTASGQYTYGPFTASTGCDSTYVLNLTIEPDTYDPQEYLQFQPVANDFHGIQGGNYLGDLDGDNDLDMIIVGRNVNSNDRTKVYLNEGDGTFIEETGLLPNVNSRVNANKLIDIDGDNDLDFVMFGLTGSTIPFINQTRLFINDGSGNFMEKTDANFPNVYVHAIDVADVDGDDDLDILIMGPGAGMLLLNDGNEVFSESPQNVFTRTEFGTVNFGDVDGDNDLDVFITGSHHVPGITTHHADLFINDGKGDFSRPFNQNFIGISSSSVVMVDLDNDGDLDLFTTGDPADTDDIANSIIYYNDGLGNFTMEITDLPEIDGDAAFEDFDEDGDEDLVLSGWLDDGNSVSPRHTGIYLNNGFGNFTLTALCSLTDLGAGAISIGDLDGDGRKDLAINGFTSESTEAGAFVYLNKEITNDLVVAVCDSFEFDGMTLTTSGDYQGHYTDEYSCSYPMNLDLTILESPEVSVAVNSATLIATEVSGATYQWYDCDTDETIAGADQNSYTPVVSGTYRVEVSNGICTSVSECFIVDVITSIAELENGQVQVFPNPTVEKVEINLPNLDVQTKVEVMDLTGRTFSVDVEHNQDGLSIRLPEDKGIYIITIHFHDQRYSTKVIKK